jgi:ankyrin repeat protein
MRVPNGIPLGSPLLLPVGTVNYVQTLKALGATVIIGDETTGMTPLMVAAEINSVEIVDMLVNEYKLVNVNEEFCGKTALHVAIIFNAVAVVELLIRSGADVNKVPTMWWMHSAWLNQWPDTDKDLLSYGARFPTEIFIRGMPLDPTHVRLELLHACDQWHSSRKCTLLPVGTVNCVATL